MSTMAMCLQVASELQLFLQNPQLYDPITLLQQMQVHGIQQNSSMDQIPHIVDVIPRQWTFTFPSVKYAG